MSICRDDRSSKRRRPPERQSHAGSGLSFELKALAASTGAQGQGMGQWLPATCQGCTSWCSKQVYVIDGRAVKVRGNPHSKVNLGAGCPRPHLAIQQVYDPDRIKVPLKRTNPKKGRNEDPRFVPISWDEALNTIADKIMELRNNDETHKYMLMRGRYSYMRDVLYDRMTKIIGSPNNISHSAICAEAEKFGPYYTEGLWDYRQYDVQKARYVLIWGADPLAANRQVSYYSKVWGDVIDSGDTSPSSSLGCRPPAAKADEWLPIIPGHDGALAAAIAHVMLTEGLWYKNFRGRLYRRRQPLRHGRKSSRRKLSRKSTPTVSSNGGTWSSRTKPLNGRPPGPAFPPNRSARWPSTMATRGTPCHLLGRVAGPCMQVRGGYASMICHALNGLVGAVDNVGGTLASQQGIHRQISRTR